MVESRFVPAPSQLREIVGRGLEVGLLAGKVRRVESCVGDLEDESSCSHSKVGRSWEFDFDLVGGANLAVDSEDALVVHCSVGSSQNVVRCLPGFLQRLRQS